MKLRITIMSVVVLLTGGGVVNLLSGMEPVRVGVVPFRIHSSEKVDYLQDVVAERLTEHLAKNKHIVIIEPHAIKASLSGRSAEREWSKEELSQVSQKINADFLVFGSLTKIEQDVSLDTSVYSSAPGIDTYRSFVEGRDLDRLVAVMENKISEHIVSVTAKHALPTETVVAQAPTAEEAEPAPASPEEPADEESAPSLPATPSTLPGDKQAAPALPAENETPPAAAPPLPPIAEPEKASPPASERRPPAAKVSRPEHQELAPGPKKLASNLPIRISSDRMLADNRERKVTFFGNVKAVKENMVIHADQMSALYNQEREIEKILAEGNVKINQENMTAACQMATYLQREQKIILTGKPKVWQGNNVVSGEKIDILVEEDKIFIEGGNKKEERVNVIFYPESRE